MRRSMMGWDRGRQVRGMAVWAVAYALVFQLLLTSSLMAAQPRGSTGHEICFAGTELLLGSEQNDSEAPAQGIHCPACLARVDLAGPPAPFAFPVLVRIGVPVAFLAPIWEAPRLAVPRLPVQPRSPPVMV